MFSDRLTALPDPTVQRFAPKLIRTIDRAVGYTKSVIDYGRALEAPPNRRPLVLKTLVDDVAELLGMDEKSSPQFLNQIDPALTIDADPEQLFRVLLNLCRNSQQSMASKEPASTDDVLTLSAQIDDLNIDILVSDTGTGIPEHLKDKLFVPYSASTKSDGTGLGMP